MSRLLSLFNFGFLKRLDRYMLLNHTLIWNIKLHYILFWGLIVNIPLVSFLYFYEMELYQVPIFYNSFFYLFAVISSLGIIYWIYKQIMYIPTKESSNLKLSGLKQYLFYLFSIVIIISVPMIIDFTIISKYKYKTHRSLNNVTDAQIIDLTSISSVSEIDSNIEVVAKNNYTFYRYNLRWRYSAYPWMYYISIFLPILLIIYQNIGLRYYLQSIILGSSIYFISAFLSWPFRILNSTSETMLLWMLIIFVTTQIILRNKMRFLFLSLIYLFYLVRFIVNDNNISVINTSDKFYTLLFSILIISLFILIFIMNYITNYMVAYKVRPKE